MLLPAFAGEEYDTEMFSTGSLVLMWSSTIHEYAIPSPVELQAHGGNRTVVRVTDDVIVSGRRAPAVAACADFGLWAWP